MAKNKTPTSTAPKYNLPPTLKVPCVLQIKGETFGGKELGIATSISTHLCAVRTPDKDSFLGFVIEFPLSAKGENTGFGNCHHSELFRFVCPIRHLLTTFPS
jgi:hypothetical protein